MKIIAAVWCLFSAAFSFAQNQEEICKNTEEIARMERRQYERLTSKNNPSFASGNFDVKYYRCEWEVDPAVRFIKGKVTVYYRVLTPSTSITFDLTSNGMTVDSVKQRNTVISHIHNSDALQLQFSSPVNAGVFDSVSIFYQGIPPNTGFGSFVQSSHAGTPVLWSLSEPYGSRDWWPCKNGLDDKADSLDVILTHPSAYRAASNGMLQSEVLTNGGATIVTSWKHRYPIASYLVCFAVTNYLTFDNSVQLGNTNLQMKTHCYPESQAVFQSNTPLVLDALTLFHNYFGEYPFIKEKYGHVQFGWGGGMEHQTATFIVSPGESLMAHELAHQWFGDKVTCGSWEDIWLNEGFATHLASFYMENKYPANALNSRRNGITSITSQPGGSVWVNDTTNPSRIFSGRLSYTKGSHLLYMLRWILGDSVFFRAVRKYHTDPNLAYGFARTEDLKKKLEQESGKNLTKFFNDWFKGEGYPSYNIEWTPIGNSYARIKMNQSTSHPSVSFFELPVALKFMNATQEKTIVLDNKIQGEIFIRNIGFRADTILVDPDSRLITRGNTVQKIPDVVSGQNIVQVYPNPVPDQFYVYLRNFAATNGTLGLYNSAGQKVYSRNINLQYGSEILELPSGQLASGVYLLRLVTDNGIKVIKKIIK